jgi:hypothetical protein
MNAPPPSEKLLAAISGMRPVRSRVPARALASLVALWAAYSAIPLVAFRLRPDLPFLPVWWVALFGSAWCAGFMIALGTAVLPRRGQVLPDGDRALTTALVIAGALMIGSALLPANAPGHSISLPLLIGMRNCMTFAVIASILPIAIGLVALRKVVIVGSWRIGAAVGAGAGALAGLILHFLCPVSGAAHVSLAHGGAVVLCALLAALTASRVLR